MDTAAVATPIPTSQRPSRIERGSGWREPAELRRAALVEVTEAALADKNSPYAFTARQLGPYNAETPQEAAVTTAADPQAND